MATETKPAVNGTHNLSQDQQLALIKADLEDDFLDFDIIEDVIRKQDRPVSIYWGTATTGRPHCAYFVAMCQIASFLRAGCAVKVLLADMHGFLDNLKAPIDLVKYRAQYYKFVIIELLKAIGVSIEKLEFVLGSSYQLTPEYQMDLLRLTTLVTINDAKRAGSDVVKQTENGTLSGLIYPLMQSLDEQYLDVDVQFGGVDQRKIFILARDILPRIGYKKRAHLMNPMVPGLAGGKMSASDPDSKIDVLDPPEVVTKKVKKAVAEPKKVEENGLLSFVRYVLFPVSEIKHGQRRFVVERRDAEPLIYENIEQMHEDYRSDILSPQTLKPALSKALNELLAPVQAAYQASKEWQEIAAHAYPAPKAEKEKPKKVKKDKKTKAPSNVQVQADGSVEGPDTDQINVGSSATSALNELKLEEEAVDRA